MAYGERFWSKVDRRGHDECWEWMAAKVPMGYGQLRIPGGHLYAHRVAYEELVGPIPDGLSLDHLCRNTSCVNPAHLEPVTHRENCLRGVGFSAKNALKTHCKRGHEFSEENTRAYRGRRLCRACDREYQLKKYHARKKQAA